LNTIAVTTALYLSFLAAHPGSVLLIRSAPCRTKDEPQVAVLAALCEKYHAEFSQASSVAVLNGTQDLLAFGALAAASDVNMTPNLARELQLIEERMHSQFRTGYVHLPCRSPCHFRMISRRTNYLSVTLIEMSNVVSSPFQPSMTGVFVRSSDGGRMGATWLWVEVKASVGGGWVVQKILSLPVFDG
jgi:hypothetical protein